MGELTALLDARDEVRDAALADGQGGSEVDEFEAAAVRRVSRLSAELADAVTSRTRSLPSTSRSRPAGCGISRSPAWRTGS